MDKLKKLSLLHDTSTGLEAVARDTKFLRTLESSTTEIREGYFVSKQAIIDALKSAIKLKTITKDEAKLLRKYFKKFGVE